MAMSIQMGGNTSISIQNGDMRKLRELLVAECKVHEDQLVELADPMTLRFTQGKVQSLRAIIEILPK